MATRFADSVAVKSWSLSFHLKAKIERSGNHISSKSMYSKAFNSSGSE